MTSEYFPPTANRLPSLGRAENTTSLRPGEALLSPKILLSLGHLPRKREITIDSSLPKTPSKVRKLGCVDVRMCADLETRRSTRRYDNWCTCSCSGGSLCRHLRIRPGLCSEVTTNSLLLTQRWAIAFQRSSGKQSMTSSAL
jgi:hypothetical protein